MDLFKIIADRDARVEKPRLPFSFPCPIPFHSLSRPCKRHVDRQDDQTAQIKSFEDPQVPYLFQKQKISKAKKKKFGVSNKK
jgi:hypothetical protein